MKPILAPLFLVLATLPACRGGGEDALAERLAASDAIDMSSTAGLNEWNRKMDEMVAEAKRDPAPYLAVAASSTRRGARGVAIAVLDEAKAPGTVAVACDLLESRGASDRERAFAANALNAVATPNRTPKLSYAERDRILKVAGTTIERGSASVARATLRAALKLQAPEAAGMLGEYVVRYPLSGRKVFGKELLAFAARYPAETRRALVEARAELLRKADGALAFAAPEPRP